MDSIESVGFLSQVTFCIYFSRIVVLRLVARNRVGDGPYCAICQVVALYLDVLLGKNKTVDAIEKAVEVVCNLLPKTYTKQVRRASLSH